MKIWLPICVLLGLAAVIGLLGLGVTADDHRSLAEDYFRALFSADAKRLRELQPPDWPYGDVVEALLDASATSLREHLGDFRGFGNWESVKKLGSERPWTVKCELVFERGSATGTLHANDGKVVAYHVRFPQLPRDWSPRIEDTSYWQARGREVLLAYASGDAERAFSMFPPKFQSDYTLERFTEDAELARRGFGPLKTIRFVSARQPSNPQLLDTYFHIQGEKQEAYAKIQFESTLAHTVIVGLGPATAEEAETGE